MGRLHTPLRGGGRLPPRAGQARGTRGRLAAVGLQRWPGRFDRGVRAHAGRHRDASGTAPLARRERDTHARRRGHARPQTRAGRRRLSRRACRAQRVLVRVCRGGPRAGRARLALPAPPPLLRPARIAGAAQVPRLRPLVAGATYPPRAIHAPPTPPPRVKPRSANISANISAARRRSPSRSRWPHRTRARWRRA